MQPGGARPGGGGVAPPGGVVGILHVVGGNDRGKAHPLTRPLTTIGRGADQDCILADIAVSRRHITISIEGSRYRLKDLGSGNGSLLNGARVDVNLLVAGTGIVKSVAFPNQAFAGSELGVCFTRIMKRWILPSTGEEVEVPFSIHLTGMK